MHQFLIDNRVDVIERCRHKLAQRARRAATAVQLQHGTVLLLDQLTRTLGAEEEGDAAESLRISGAPGGAPHAMSQIGVSAAAHGKELLELGFSVDQVVHDYGDLCRSITDLAVERNAAFPIQDFRTLNRCLDNAIADAVAEFSRLRDIELAQQQVASTNERMGFLVHELRNATGTATLAFSALELGQLPIDGSTGAVLKRSLLVLTDLVGRSLDDVRRSAGGDKQAFDLAAFIEDAKATAQLDAGASRCKFRVPAVEPGLGIRGNRQLLLAAVGNLLQNAFKFTHDHTEVTLKVFASARHVRIEVADHCGGLPAGSAEEMFTPFRQRSGDRSGLGLGVTIARQSIEADAGTLNVRDVPGVGCVFTVRLPRQTARQRGA
jgi:signal transduction histidine kinase